MAKLPPQPLGVPPGSSYWNDWYEKLRTFVDQITTSVDWSIITGKPTTLAGYGITDSPVGANPTAAVDLTAVNGTATTFMRSDAAPVLSVTITPTWTGTHAWITSIVGANYNMTLNNTDNTNAASGARFLIRSGGATAGDPFIAYAIQGIFAWSTGIDNSDGDKFKISGAATLGAGADFLSITTAGTATFGGAVEVNSATLLKSNTALTNGAAAAAGTLLNAPVAGNPTKWAPINDNGTIRYIPMW